MPENTTENHYQQYTSFTHYELSNHLGNVMATITDHKTLVLDNGFFSHYEAVVVSATDYYPFGWSMPGRHIDSDKYRFGFNGKENDTEWQKQDYGFRIHDNRIGRFLSVDPITKDYPELTPYQFASNTPIMGIDRDGLEVFYAHIGSRVIAGVYTASSAVGVSIDLTDYDFNVTLYGTKSYGVALGLDLSYGLTLGVTWGKTNEFSGTSYALGATFDFGVKIGGVSLTSAPKYDIPNESGQELKKMLESPVTEFNWGVSFDPSLTGVGFGGGGFYEKVFTEILESLVNEENIESSQLANTITTMIKSKANEAQIEINDAQLSNISIGISVYIQDIQGINNNTVEINASQDLESNSNFGNNNSNNKDEN